jgi:hypothetical protein
MGMQLRQYLSCSARNLANKQLARMRRLGRLTIGDESRKLIAIRLDTKSPVVVARDGGEKRKTVPIARQRNTGRADAEGELISRDVIAKLKSKDLL